MIYEAEERNMDWRGWVAILGGALGAFMAILDIQVTNASLREISGNLGLSNSQSGWISTSYLVAEIIVIPLTAFLSQVFGLRRYIIFNCLGFIIASILCGFSWNLPSIATFRFLQGLTGGTLIPLAFQLILTLMPQKQKNIGLTIFGLTVTLAPTLGPSLGGWLTEQYSWRLIFFINILPGIFLITAMVLGLKPVKVNFSKLRDLDLFSLFSLVLGLGSLSYMLEEGPRVDWFEDSFIRVCFFTCLLVLPMFVIRQLSISKPLLRLSLFKNRNFLLGTIITAIAACALFSGIYALSLYLGQVQDYSAAQIGNVLMWVGLPQIVIMPALPFLMKRADLRLLSFVGICLFVYSNHLNSGLNIDYGGEQFRWSLLIRAVGQPLFVIPLSVMAMAMIKPNDAGDASAIFNVMRNLGASIGIAMTSSLLMVRQAMHFIRYCEGISSFDFHITEILYASEMKLRGLGLDAPTAKAKAFMEIMKAPVRDSVIQSFSDIFILLTLGLIFCAVLTLCLKKVSAQGAKSFESHH